MDATSMGIKVKPETLNVKRGVKTKTLGIIGFGAFGKFMAGHLKNHFPTLVYSRRDISIEARSLGVITGTFEQVASCDIVIIAVTYQHFESTVRKLKDFVKPEALVLDVCSIKEGPVRLMLEHLPKSVDIVATHPIFGPQSGKHGIEGLTIVVCPVRVSKSTFAQMNNFLAKQLKLDVSPMSPAEHDKLVAYILGLTHFISRALKSMDIPDVKHTTPAYRKLIEIRDILKNDSQELFHTIVKSNPYVKTVRRDFMKSLTNLEEEIDKQ